MSEWQSLESLPAEGWVVGKVDSDDGPPVFVGELYDNPFYRGSDRKSLIDRWSGRWREIFAWAPLPVEEQQS